MAVGGIRRLLQRNVKLHFFSVCLFKRQDVMNPNLQVRLSSIGVVRLVDRRGYLTVVLPRCIWHRMCRSTR